MGNVVGSRVRRRATMPRHAPHKGIIRRKLARDTSKQLPKISVQRKCLLRLHRLNRMHDYLLMEKEYVKRESARSSVRRELVSKNRIVRLLRGSPIAVASVRELFIDNKHAVVSMESSSAEWYVPILSIVDKERLRVGSTVLVRAAGLFKTVPTAVVGVLEDDVDARSASHKIEKPPSESFEDIGGLDAQIQEMKEAVELPLVHPEYYTEMGISAPKGVILYGAPGTGKTLLAKAVAHSTLATFIRVTGADFVQKNSGEGSKFVREIFRLAKESAPSIIFIDEIDAVGTKRYSTSCGGEKEVQRTMLELLNQMDGFDDREDVKVILATNRIDVLDPALIRPGRIDRKIELPLPDDKAKLKICQIHAAGMNLAKDVDFQKIIFKDRNFSGADCKAICTEAGMLALRAQRKKVSAKDFEQAAERVIETKKGSANADLFFL